MMAGEKRVFVVEDHPPMARAVKRYLEESGYEVILAADVRSALRMAARKRFDVLVCDIHLPDGTGWDLMKQLTARGAVNGIAFSAFDEPEDCRRSKEAGFAAHVPKGGDTNLLLSTIEKVIEHKRRCP
jgi:CheY-like chemotaxis protein